MGQCHFGGGGGGGGLRIDVCDNEVIQNVLNDNKNLFWNAIRFLFHPVQMTYTKSFKK